MKTSQSGNKQGKVRIILVTGAHRSGTTWVRKTLAQAPGAVYLHEPFSLQSRPGIFDLRAERRWYPYVCQENSRHFLAALSDTLSFRYSLRSELRSRC